ncbi:hypothetical protein [uncultured Pelagimonas sp.]|uniref:DUF5983 family protein n=1 Tax=uncultured Pelagimonas sp. TaxID=1618102 RepID=UPI002604F77B|nr:hypothetical protein [uncultured Pelagimonas sp.]
MTIETQKIAVMSTAHLTRDAAIWLEDRASDSLIERSCGVIEPTYLIWDMGPSILISRNISFGSSVVGLGSIRACIDHAAMGCPDAAFILFDRDADQIDGLPVYDW